MHYRLLFELYSSIGPNPGPLRDHHRVHDDLLSCTQKMFIGGGRIGGSK